MNSYTALLILAWTAFFILHSLLAGHTAKAWVKNHWPRLYRQYRLTYNVVALITIVPAMVYAWVYPSPLLWQWQGTWDIAYWLLMIFCAWVTIVSSRQYDMKAFLGLSSQAPGAIHTGDEPFALSDAHRYVRHPWYSAGLLIIWIQDMHVNWLISCVLMSVYFWFGSRLEESKLLDYYGEPYRRYRQKVPGLIPRPWRMISKQEAKALMALTATPHTNESTL